jgi:Cu(I)/Ag(I) efflux system protein CusF
MKTLSKFALAISFTLFSAMAWADGADHAAHQPASSDTAQPAAASASTAAEMSEGVIRKVDTEQKKITIRHGELKNLDMPPMTMVFRVADPAFAEQVNVGDEVNFVAEKIDGKFTVTRIEKK